MEGSKYVAYYTRSFSASSSPWLFSYIETNISQGKPVQAGLVYYDNNNNVIGGHVVVIKGTAHVEDSTGSYWFISYIDPDDGASYSMPYNTFCYQSGSSITRVYQETVYVSN